ncbi:hypothetical protein [Halocatena salina]|uniref:Uncharacterized protein n=1 Tax=Halocatena salina TaxID=2934340 RepID=A0A8U0A1E6_9EURY|nr:hypothetical protein [Halocatena salina]UPM42686.1 hypothetical protein MW046_12080 [Halocatena salina]
MVRGRYRCVLTVDPVDRDIDPCRSFDLLAANSCPILAGRDCVVGWYPD